MMTDREVTRPVRVLVVDDSQLLRRGMRAILENAGVVVIGECATGLEAVAKVATLRPDVVTMDLDMPGLDGLATIERIMAEHPTPILVVTGDPKFRGLDGQFEALARGAVDLVAKPNSTAIEECNRLVDRIRMVASVSVVPHVRGAARRRNRTNHPTEPLLPSASARISSHLPPALVAIGASTGGPGAVRVVLDGLGAELGVPVVVVQHMAEEFAEGFVRWLRSQVAMPVVEAVAGTRMVPNTAYVAVRGPHLRVGEGGKMLVAVPGPADPHRPSIDVMFAGAASAWGKRAIGILLTGMGDDGADGLGAIASSGGLTIAQDEESCVVFGMPGAAIDRGAARLVLNLHNVARVTRDVCRGVRQGGVA